MAKQNDERINRIAVGLDANMTSDWGTAFAAGALPSASPSTGNPARTLPAGIAPRGLSRRAAAEYCGLLPTTFDARVNDGLLPAPVFSGRSRVWDRLALDHALNLLSGFDDRSSNAAEEEALRAIRHGDGKRALRS